MTRKKEKSNLIKWFIDEGALKQNGNLYIAERAFRANSVISWIKKNSLNKTLNKKEIEESMLTVRLFLQNKINLEWKDGIINVLTSSLDEEENICVEKPIEGNV